MAKRVKYCEDDISPEETNLMNQQTEEDLENFLEYQKQQKLKQIEAQDLAIDINREPFIIEDYYY